MTSTEVTSAGRAADGTAGARHVALAITVLALGGFAIGTTEFVTMGLLPEIARGIHESIPTTGHVITAYAFGVVVGAPVIVSLGARLPRRELVVALVLAVGLGNAATALAHGYWQMMAARFVAGLPHGAYFGVASLIAASLVSPERKGRAVSGVMLGLSVATVVGVPASTWLGQDLGWRSAYWTVLAITLLTGVLLLFAVPHTPGNRDATVVAELQALRKPQVLYAVTAGMVGFGGLFAMYSYVAPLVTHEAGLARSAIPWFLLAFGIGSVFGSWLAGRLADWDVERALVGGFVCVAAALVLIWLAGGVPAALWVLVLLVGVLGSVLAINLQLRLMHVAGDAQMLGAALNHSALNVANGLGAWLGSIAIATGHGYRAPSLVGAGLAVVGLVVFLAALRAQRATSPA
ncbi:MAG: MFS transporter [Propionibacteriales bacterium]|nr:MFS transporter [Propionibacteriales bacterium]